MMITLQDVANIFSLPIVSDEIFSLHNQTYENSSFSFDRSINGYPHFITAHMKTTTIILVAYHNAFLLDWYCKYFICSSYKAIVSEYAFHVSLLQSDKFYSLYKSIFLLLEQMRAGQHISSASSPLCDLQLWITRYFLMFTANKPEIG